MRNDEAIPYNPLFNRQEYHKLYDRATLGDQVRYVVHGGSYRDKRIQRMLYERNLSAYHALTCDLEEVPCLINHDDPTTRTIAKWRLDIAK